MFRLLSRWLLAVAVLAMLAMPFVGCVSVGGKRPLVDIDVKSEPEAPPATYYVEPYPEY